MLLVCVCESSKKSLPKMRKILAKYFYQVGRRTWMGKLSLEGSEDLEKELKEKATRQTSVTCWKYKAGKAVLHFHVGSKARLSEDGTYAYSVTKSKEKEIIIKSKEDKLLLSILKLSALFHDLGKSTIAFQNKLLASVENDDNKIKRLQKDVVRHEVVSCFILQGVFKDFQTDGDLFIELSCQKKYVIYFHKMQIPI